MKNLKLTAPILALSLAVAASAFAPVAFTPVAFAQDDETPAPVLTPTQIAWQKILKDNDIEAARLKVKEPGFDPLLPLPYEFSPLLGEVLSAHETEIAALIIEAAPTEAYLSNANALGYLGQTENLPVLKVLLAKPKFDPNQLLSGDPLLFAVVQAKNVEGVKVMLADARVDAGARGESDKTVLFPLAGTHSTELAQLFLADKRVDPAAKTTGESTALHEAAGSNDAEIVTALLADPRVDVNAANDRGISPLMVAATTKLDMVLLLLRDPRVKIGADEVQRIGALVQRNEDDAANADVIAEIKKLVAVRFANK